MTGTYSVYKYLRRLKIEIRIRTYSLIDSIFTQLISTERLLIVKIQRKLTKSKNNMKNDVTVKFNADQLCYMFLWQNSLNAPIN